MGAAFGSPFYEKAPPRSWFRCGLELDSLGRMPCEGIDPTRTWSGGGAEMRRVMVHSMAALGFIKSASESRRIGAAPAGGVGPQPRGFMGLGPTLGQHGKALQCSRVLEACLHPSDAEKAQ
jgi:hypothetical protein